MSSTLLSPRFGSDFANWREGPLRLSVVIGAHLLVLFLLAYNYAITPTLSLPAPIMVSLIKSTEPTPVPPIEIPKPKQVKLPDPTKKILVAETTRPSPVDAVAPPDPEPPAPAPQASDIDQAIILPDVNAAYLDNPKIPYPPLSRRAGEQGKLYLRVVVNTQGLVDAIEVSRSSGFSRLDSAALDAVRKWKFNPGRQGSRVVVASVIVPVSFSLTER
jgi:protein TonB